MQLQLTIQQDSRQPIARDSGFCDVCQSQTRSETAKKNARLATEFFEEVIGGWEGEKLVRDIQPDLVTHNTREFGRIEGLVYEDWEAE